MEEVRVRILRAVEELEQIRPIWVQWQQNPNCDIDFRLNHLNSKPELSPVVFVLYRRGHAEAMLIGAIEEGTTEINFGYAKLLGLRTRTLVFAYGGLLGNLSRENSEILISEVVAFLREGHADITTFRPIKTDTAIYRCALRVPGLLLRDQIPTVQIHRILKLPATFEEFQLALPGVERREMKRRAKKLTSEFSGRFLIRRFQQPAEIPAMLDDVETVAQKTYQRGLGFGLVKDEVMQKRWTLEAKMGWLRAYILYVSETPIAFWIGTLYKNVFHGDFIGYDRDYAKYAPGMFLMMKGIEEMMDPAASEKVTAIDFGLGDADYKAVLCKHNWQEGSLHIFAPTFKGVAMNWIRIPSAAAERLGKRMLRGTGLLSKLKKAWRDRAARALHTQTTQP